MDRQIDGQTDRWIDRQMDRQTDGQTDRWIDRYTDRGLEKLYILTVWKNKSVQAGTGFIISNFVRSTWKTQDLKRKVSQIYVKILYLMG